jgi:hypothetical protein
MEIFVDFYKKLGQDNESPISSGSLWDEKAEVCPSVNLDESVGRLGESYV